MSDEQPTGDFWERTFDQPKIARGGCYGVVVAGAIGIAMLATQCGSGRLVEPTEEPVANSLPGEIEIVTACEMAVKAALVSPSSYKGAMAWDFKDHGAYATVLRRFEATNAMGGYISGTYLCKWDKARQRIASVETIDATNKHIVIQ